MNFNSIKNKKSLKIAIMLLSSLLIAGVSASTYYTMLMNANVSVSSGNLVVFSPGTDWGSSSMGDGNQTCTLALSGGNGTIATYPDPVTINNTDTSSGYTINLQLDSWDGNDQSELNYINVTVYNDVAAGTQQGNTIYLVPGGSGQVETTGDLTIPASGTWRVEWIIYWKSTAVSETVTVNLKLVVS
jgi:hypothetical protein